LCASDDEIPHKTPQKPPSLIQQINTQFSKSHFVFPSFFFLYIPTFPLNTPWSGAKMDTNDWVVLSDDSLFDVNEDCVEKQVFLGKRNLDSKSVFDVDDYYFCTSPKFKKTSEDSRNFHPMVPKESVHIPIRLESRIGEAPDEGLVEETAKEHVEVTLVPSSPIAATEKIKGVVVEADQDTVPHLLSKIREIESPKSLGMGLFLKPEMGGLKFEEIGREAQEMMVSPRMKIDRDLTVMESSKEVEDCGDGFNFWKWSLNGVGAICSFGVAAATICVLIFGSNQRNKFHQDQKIRFQIYTDDKVSKCPFFCWFNISKWKQNSYSSDAYFSVGLWCKSHSFCDILRTMSLFTFAKLCSFTVVEKCLRYLNIEVLKWPLIVIAED